MFQSSVLNPAQSASKSQVPTTDDKLLKEKERLIQLEQKYKQKIEEYKKQQAQKEADMDVEIIEVPPEEVKTEDIIVIDDSDEDNTVEDPPRRRSLLDVGNSTVPDLNSNLTKPAQDWKPSSESNVYAQDNKRKLEMLDPQGGQVANIRIKVEKTDDNTPSTSVQLSPGKAQNVTRTLTGVSSSSVLVKPRGGFVNITLKDGIVVSLPKQGSRKQKRKPHTNTKEKLFVS